MGVVVFAVYFQTMTGFGLAMIIMGIASGMGIAPVSDLATIVSIIMLINNVVALRGHWHQIDWAIARVLMFSVVPASIAGVILLDYLSGTAASLLKLLLGAVIIYGGVSFALQNRALPALSSHRSFFSYGFLGGLIGGMFGIAGPPLIYQLYRQPLSMTQIRTLLFLMFGTIAAMRTAFVAVQGQLTMTIFWISLLCLPIGVLATLAARRYPVPMPPAAMRRIAFMVLILMGAGLMIPALPPALELFAQGSH